MEKIISTLRKEFEEGLSALPEELTPQSVRVLADIASVLMAAHKLSGKSEKAAWKDDVEEELESAEEKISEYAKTHDQDLISMARDEARHAAYYLKHARMDPNMQHKLADYQKRYDNIEAKLAELPGAKKLPEL
jgi:hypothetical protein